MAQMAIEDRRVFHLGASSAIASLAWVMAEPGCVIYHREGGNFFVLASLVDDLCDPRAAFMHHVKGRWHV